MKPRITLITLGVGDLERSLASYRALGLESEGIAEHGACLLYTSDAADEL